ncbi:MAG TPA: CHAT domain-containing protein [Kofleriaceae bacterium]|jgi:CHAT domain-containing protein
MAEHTILLLAVAPCNSTESALIDEAGTLYSELRRTARRECFSLETRWASEPLDLLRALREVKPTVVHCSGHGDRTGLWFPTIDGKTRAVPPAAIAHAFEAAGSSVRLIVLSSCDSAPFAEALLPHVACIVGISAAISAESARAFLIGFYGALGESESVSAAFRHGNAAVSLVAQSDTDPKRPQLWVRIGVDADNVFLVPYSKLDASSHEDCEEPRQLHEHVVRPERSISRSHGPEGLSARKVERTTRQKRRHGVALSAAPLVVLLLAFAAWARLSPIQSQAVIAISPTRAMQERLVPKPAVSMNEYRASGRIEFNDQQWEPAYQQGLAAERRNDPVAAEEALRASIARVEDMRARAMLDTRPSVLDAGRRPYDALFDLLARQHKGVDALTVAEQLHARTWLDARAMTGEIRVRPVLGVAPAVEALSTKALFSLLGDREALIYVYARGALWRLHVEGHNVIELTQVPAMAEAWLARWRQDSDNQDILDQLGAMLIPVDIMPSDRPLYIVAQGPLSSFSFATLRRSERYLINDRPLVRLSGLAELQCRPRPSNSTIGVPIVIADPNGDLPRARAEAQDVGQVLMGKVFIGRDATSEALFDAREASLLHVAMHASSQPEGGSLRLTDGKISGSTVLGQHIAPAVAVLATCSSAPQDDPEGWGALSEAFLAVGTRTVVATLGPVRDEDASVLMHAFYAFDGWHHPATALAAAQRSVARTSKMSPSQWGKFVVWGHAEPSECHEE